MNKRAQRSKHADIFFFPFPLFSRPSFLAAGLAGVVFFGTFQAVPTSQSAAPDVKGDRAKSKPLLRSCGRGHGWRLVASPMFQLHAGPRLRECFMGSAYTQGRCHSTPSSSQLKIYWPTPGGWQVWERSGRGIHLFLNVVLDKWICKQKFELAEGAAA